MTKSYRQLFLRASFVLIFFSAFFVYPQSGSVFTDDKKHGKFLCQEICRSIRHFNELLKINKNNKEYNALSVMPTSLLILTRKSGRTFAKSYPK